jgi:hypothetical protein
MVKCKTHWLSMVDTTNVKVYNPDSSLLGCFRILLSKLLQPHCLLFLTAELEIV